MSKSKIKCMLICFFNSHRTVHSQFEPRLLISTWFLKNFEKEWCVWDKTSRTTGCCIMTRFLATQQFQLTSFWPKRTFVWQPPYLLNLNPCNFFLFLKLKNCLKRLHIGTVKNIQRTVTNQLKAIPESDFQHCYNDWKNHF